MASSDDDNSEPLYFKCGSCTFRHEEEDRFISHIHEDHKQEYGFWCGFCGKHFSVAPPLVKHMKESCTRSSLFNLKCGFEDCSFNTTEPMTFINHLKIVHKGLHLLPCLNCQRVFTIPACLIEHMQKECTKGFRIENRAQAAAGDAPDSSNNSKKSKPAPASVKKKMAQMSKEADDEDEQDDEEDEEEEEEEEEPEEITPLPTKPAPKSKKNAKKATQEESEDSDAELMEILPDRRGRLQRTAKTKCLEASKRRASKHYDESDEVDDLDEDDIENGSDSGDAPRAKRGRGRPVAAGRPKAKRTRK